MDWLQAKKHNKKEGMKLVKKPVPIFGLLASMAYYKRTFFEFLSMSIHERSININNH